MSLVHATAVTAEAALTLAANAKTALIAVQPQGNAGAGGTIPTTPGFLVVASQNVTVPASGGSVAVWANAWVTKDANAGGIDFAIEVDGIVVDGDTFAMAALATANIARVFKTAPLVAGAHVVRVIAGATAGQATLGSGDGQLMTQVVAS